MRFAALCLLSALALPAQSPAKITVFREKTPGHSFAVAYEQLFYQNREWVDSRYRFSIYLDDAYVAELRVGRFVTLEVAPGRHVIRTKRSEPVVLDLKSGERVYLQPGLYSKVLTALRVPETIQQISSCREVAATIGSETLAPSKSRDLYSAAVAEELSFPACSD